MDLGQELCGARLTRQMGCGLRLCLTLAVVLFPLLGNARMARRAMKMLPCWTLAEDRTWRC